MISSELSIPAVGFEGTYEVSQEELLICADKICVVSICK